MSPFIVPKFLLAAEEHYSHREHSSQEESGWGIGLPEKPLSPGATALPDGSFELDRDTAPCTSPCS